MSPTATAFDVGTQVRWLTVEEAAEDEELIREMNYLFGSEGLTIHETCQVHVNMVRLAKDGKPFRFPNHTGWVTTNLLRPA